MNHWNSIADHGRVWIYTTKRPLNETEEKQISETLEKFCEKWAAHGNDLFAGHEITHHRFIVLTVDEEKAAASGCSIDSSVAVMRDIEAALNLDLFNRTRIYLATEEGIEQTDLTAARANIENGTWSGDTQIVNTTVLTKGDWIKAPLIRIRDSWMKRFLKEEDQVA